MSFQVPLSSSPMAPSTPGSDKLKADPFAASKSFASNTSTTPAGPPPSSARSFTPTGPPPSSLFGSSQMGSGKTLFKGRAKAPAPSRGSTDSSKLARFLDQSNNFNFGSGNGTISKGNFSLPDSSPPSRFLTEANSDEYEEEQDEQDQEDEDEDEDEASGEEYAEEEDSQDLGVSLIAKSMNDDPSRVKPHNHTAGSITAAVTDRVSAKAPSSPRASSASNGTPRGLKRSRHGAMVPYKPSGVDSISREPLENAPHGPSIAQDMSKQMEAAFLEEPDDLIVGTEECISSLYAASSGVNHYTNALASALSGACERLCTLWISCRDRDAKKASWREEVVMGIGPEDGAPGLHGAAFLSTLLLSLHHPAAAKGGQALAMPRLNRSTQTSLTPYSPDVPLNPTAYPKVLLDWLDKNHNPYRAIYSEVQTCKPNPTTHDFYWDILYKLAIRGKFADLIAMLKGADFRRARSAREDGQKESGYHGGQLDNINMVIGWCILTLQACPALTDEDWHVPGNSWTIFRKHIEKAIDNLVNFAEGRDKDLDHEESAFEASKFGLASASNDLSRSSRRAESRVPWTILQNLKTLYGILLGGSLEILSYSENWVEGTIALTAWWSGEDDEDVALGGLAASRRSLKHKRSRGPRLVDTDTGLAYRRRMALAFERVTQEPGDSNDPPMLPDTGKPLEVALSALFDGDYAGTIGILRAMSLPIADAVAEIGTIGHWLRPSPRDALTAGLDQDDMDLLSFDRSVLPTEEATVNRKSIMLEYAEELFNRPELTGHRGVIVEGWELAIAVLARLGTKHKTSSTKEIRKILKRLPLDSDAQIDKIFHICRNYDMPEDGRKIVEQYADFVLDTSDDYGTALIYYARAHSRKKIKDVLDLLISYSLVQSTAYPTAASLDTNLHSFVFAPQESLEHLALLDEEGAEILHEALSGYATLRKFYKLRDEEANLAKGQKLKQDSYSRKKAAAAALLAVINSAADNIHGGLYDESRSSVVHVGGLLALLGEAMVFVTQKPPILNLTQCLTLLKAIEDLSTVTPLIYAQSDEFLHATLTAYTRGPSALASPRQMLQKQMSSITSNGTGAGGSSSFSLVGSSLLDEQLVDAMDIDSGGGTGGSSRALTRSGGDEEEVNRGWDWRSGMMMDDNDGANGEDLLRILRLGLARDVAACWMRGEGV